MTVVAGFHTACCIQEEKLRYYWLMIELEEHDNEFLNVCRHYMQIYDTASVKEDDNQWKEVWLHTNSQWAFKQMACLHRE
jgi:hypothetical protein